MGGGGGWRGRDLLWLDFELLWMTTSLVLNHKRDTYHGSNAVGYGMKKTITVSAWDVYLSVCIAMVLGVRVIKHNDAFLYSACATWRMQKNCWCINSRIHCFQETFLQSNVPIGRFACYSCNIFNFQGWRKQEMTQNKISYSSAKRYVYSTGFIYIVHVPCK